MQVAGPEPRNSEGGGWQLSGWELTLRGIKHPLS